MRSACTEQEGLDAEVTCGTCRWSVMPDDGYYSDPDVCICTQMLESPSYVENEGPKPKKSHAIMFVKASDAAGNGEPYECADWERKGAVV